MDMSEIEKQKALAFAEYCGKHADFLPDAELWIFYKENETVKKTTKEMMKEFINQKV